MYDINKSMASNINLADVKKAFFSAADPAFLYFKPSEKVTSLEICLTHELLRLVLVLIKDLEKKLEGGFIALVSDIE